LDEAPKTLEDEEHLGGSIVVTLPEELVETQKIKENEFVEIIVEKCWKDGFGILKGRRRSLLRMS
jgi:hypothetical protein